MNSEWTTNLVAMISRAREPKPIFDDQTGILKVIYSSQRSVVAEICRYDEDTNTSSYARNCSYCERVLKFHNDIDDLKNEKECLEILQAIQGSFVPILYSEGVWEGHPALMLQHLKGSTLQSMQEQKCDYGMDIQQQCQGIHRGFQELTKYGIVHFDAHLKNVMLARTQLSEYRIYIIDFDQAEKDDDEERCKTTNEVDAEKLCGQLRKKTGFITCSLCPSTPT